MQAVSIQTGGPMKGATNVLVSGFREELLLHWEAKAMKVIWIAF